MGVIQHERNSVAAHDSGGDYKPLTTTPREQEAHIHVDVTNGRSAGLHAFSFRGEAYAYLPRTGDLVQLAPDIYRAIREYQSGDSASVVRHRHEADWGRARVREALTELRVLLDSGNLSPQAPLRGAARAQFKARLLRHQPRHLMLFVTEACNLACVYCYEIPNGVHKAARTLRQGNAEAIIDHFLSTSGSRSDVAMTFFGGEPLLNLDVIKHCVQHAKVKAAAAGKSIRFTMTTNLTRLTAEALDLLIAEEFYVMVSIDGPQELHDEQRKTASGESTYELVVTNLKTLIERQRKAGIRPANIRATLPKGYPDPIGIERHLLSLGPNSVMLGTWEDRQSEPKRPGQADLGSDPDLGAPWRAHVDAFLASLETPGVIMPISPSLLRGLHEVNDEILRNAVNSEAAPKLCGVCRNMKAVSPTGDIYPCHRYVGMPAFKVGNVHEGGMELSRVKQYYERILGSFAGKCTKCWARNLCGGQCPWYLSTSDGQVELPNEDSCKGIRSGFELRLGLYSHLLVHHPAVLRQLIGESVDLLVESTPGCKA